MCVNIDGTGVLVSKQYTCLWLCACACARAHIYPYNSAQYLEINLSSGHLLIQIFPMAGNLLSPGCESDSTGLMASRSSGASFIPKLPKMAPWNRRCLLETIIVFIFRFHVKPGGAYISLPANKLGTQGFRDESRSSSCQASGAP